MRFICLTSITLKSDLPTSDVDWDHIKSSTRRYTGLNGVENPCHIQTVINEFKEYAVTDVSIEFLKNVCDSEDIKNKEFEITTWWFTFERNKILMEIKMEPGSVNIKEFDKVKHLVKLKFPKNSNEDLPIWISEVCIRFLNVLPTKSKDYLFIRDSYNAYLIDVQQHIAENNYDEEQAFELAKHPYERKFDKALRQRMTDIKAAINDLCYCPSGTTPKIPANARYVGESYWQKWQNLIITTSKEYNSYLNKTKNNTIALQFNSVNVSLLDIGWFEHPHFNDLLYINVTFLETSIEAWTQFAKCLSTLFQLLILRISANLEDIPDIVFHSIPDCLMHLNLAYNRLTKISPYISRLKQLQGLYLDYNESMDTDGIPWRCLPITIETLSFEKTGLKSIPQNIQRLKNLKVLKFTDTNIHNIPWTFINSNIRCISGTFNDLIEINNNNFPHLEMLDVRNASISQSTIVPLNLKQLHLINTSIQDFNIAPDYLQLHSITLKNNILTSFPWNVMPPNLQRLNLSYNLFQELTSMQHWIKLKYLDMSFNQIHFIECNITPSNDDTVTPTLDFNLYYNQIQYLPAEFENCTQIAELNISNNKFSYEKLSESLWNKLPKLLKSLTLDGLDLRTLPCMLKKFPLNDLSAAGCNLHYICPQLSRQCEPFLFLDITENFQLKNLPFMPKNVFPPPDASKKDIECYDLEENWANFGGNNCHSIKVFTSLPKQNNKEFEYDEKNQLILSFKKLRKNKNVDEYFCKCCANCGIETNENMVEELMTMDFPMFQEVEKCSLERTTTKKLPGEPSHIELSKAEKWTSVFKTRLCQKCQEWFKMDAKRIIIKKTNDKRDDPQPSKKRRVEETAPDENMENDDGSEMDEEDDIEDENEDETEANNGVSIPATYQYNEPNGCSSRTIPSIIHNQQIQQNFVFSNPQQQLFHSFPQQNYPQSYQNDNSFTSTPIEETFSSPYQPSTECPISYVLYDPSKATDDDLKKL